MTQGLAPVLLVGLVGGVVAAGGTSLLMTPPAVEAEASLTPEEAQQLLAGMEALRDDNSVLKRRLESLESASTIQAPAPRTEIAVPPSLEEEQTQAAIRDFVESFGDPEAAPTQEFLVSVETALQNIRDQEQAERDARRAAQRAERLDERLAEMAVELDLTPTQTGDLKVLLTDTDAKRDAMMTAMREGSGDWGNAREQFRALTDEANLQAQQILTPTQYEKYSEMNTGWGGRGGFGRGGGGGGNDGGGRRGGNRGGNGF